MRHFLIIIAILFSGLFNALQAQTAINTSFESSEGYVTGNVHNVSGWKTTSGTANITSEADYLFSGDQALRTSATASALQVEHIAYASNSSGLAPGGIVYVDMYLKFITLPTVNYGITGYDLASGNHRSFMVEFQPTSKIKIYDGSSGWTTQPTYIVNTWTRFSFRIDNGAGTYQVAVDGKAVDKVFGFREIRNSATTFDYHSIRFAMASGTCNTAIDRLYVGTDALNDVNFGSSELLYSINIQQPTAGIISLSPEKQQYQMNDEVTAMLTLPSDYEFMGWTGDLAGVDNPRTFRIQKNMTIGASVTNINTAGIVRSVTNVTEFRDALNKMNPGDTILVNDGTYNLGSIKISRSGTQARRIIIKSVHLHGAKITGKSALNLFYQNFVTYEGFDFDTEPVSTIIKLEGCSYIRISRNKFSMQKLSDTQTSKWITIGDIWENQVCNSHHNRIDHNLFDGKYDTGAWLVIDGSHGTAPDISKYDRIDHNIFRNNTPRVTNEKETIRIGVSDLSLLSSFTMVENNLFENCDGDPEFVSVKSCNNTIRNNTFRKCLGTLSLRHGHNSIVSGNFFFGEGKTAEFNGTKTGCGGIRVYGMNHQIFNNYMEGLTGNKWDAAITITNGDVANNSTNLTSHFLPENVIFAHNTLVNNFSNIEIGFDNNGNYNKAPKNCKIINNLITANENAVIKSFSDAALSGVEFINNLIHTTGNATVGLIDFTSSQIMTSDPLLEKTSCRTTLTCDYQTSHPLFKLTSLSPALNNRVAYELAQTDIEGQPSAGIRDIGADELNSDNPVLNAPMDSTTAGPNTPETYEFETKLSSSTNELSLSPMYCSPNPFKNNTTIYLQDKNKSASSATISIYDLTGMILLKKIIEVESGKINLTLNAKGIFTGTILINNQLHKFKIISQ